MRDDFHWCWEETLRLVLALLTLAVLGSLIWVILDP